jgi:putative transposase
MERFCIRAPNGFVSGHDFSRAESIARTGALAPGIPMAIPIRRSSGENIGTGPRTFFVTTSTAQKRHLLQSERMASFFIEVLLSYRDQNKFLIHAFTVMPDHVHILLTVGPDLTIERAVQFIKGGFSYRAKKELHILAEIWQRGFSEVRILDYHSYAARHRYIGQNAVDAGLAEKAESYPFSSASGKYRLDEEPQGLKPDNHVRNGTTKVVP